MAYLTKKIRETILCFLITVSTYNLFAQSLEILDTASYPQRMKWWNEARFGMFIHWGLYSQIGYNEWAMEIFSIPYSEYYSFRDRFNPQRFNAAEWVQLASEAGMKYMVVTTKHHDGFCMFDSDHTSFDIMSTPYRNDPVAALSAECNKQGIKFGAYYSMLDWHHPNYSPVRSYWDTTERKRSPDSAKYFSYLSAQISEIQKKYHPAIFWFDWQKDMKNKQLMMTLWQQMMIENPQLIINNRLHASGKPGDYLTPENWIPIHGYKDNNGNNISFEVCYTIDRTSWGYNPYSRYFLSTRDIIRTLCEVASKGGNLLLNIGPKPDGSIQDEFKIRLTETGQWLKKYGESIYGTSASVLAPLPFYGRSTTKNNIVYLQVFNMPKDSIIRFPRLKNTITAIRLTDQPAQPLNWRLKANEVVITMPAGYYDPNCFVLSVETDGAPISLHSGIYFPAADTIRLPVTLCLPSKQNKPIEQGYKINYIELSAKDTLFYSFKTESAGLYKSVIQYSFNQPEKTIQAQITFNGEPVHKKISVPNRRSYVETTVSNVLLSKGENTISVTLPELDDKVIFKFEGLILIPYKN